MFFEAQPDDISKLNSQSLVQLMKRLMLAESRSCGIPLRSSSTPLQITVPDGGEDGRVEWTGGNEETDYFPCRFNILQAKAQNLTKSTIKQEILTKSTRNKKTSLNPALNEVLDNNGAYIVFDSHAFTNRKCSELIKAIKDTIKENGRDPNEASEIGVYDANKIADWTNSHPSVALWLASQHLGRPLYGFRSHESWGKSPGIANIPYQDNDSARFVPVNFTKAQPSSSDLSPLGWSVSLAVQEIFGFFEQKGVSVRVYGPSGFGKTRFVYELFLATDDVLARINRNQIIYVDGSVSGDDAVNFTLELAENSQHAILIVDECSDDLHSKLAENVERAESELRMITINTETKLIQKKNTLPIRLERADDETIKDIAKGITPEIDDGVAGFIAEMASGFPKMAVLAAEQGGRSRETIQSSEQVLERIIWGEKASDSDGRRALEIASLFDWFGLEGRVDNQATFLASELAELSLAKFTEYILSFKLRGIIKQRGDFTKVDPIPLAASLGLRRLSLMTSNRLGEIFDAAPTELQDSLLKRLRWLDTSEVAQEFTARLLQPDKLGSLPAFETKEGSERLRRLVHVCPTLVSATIQGICANLSHDDLQMMTDSRRNLVWALTKLVFRKETFDSSARLLLRLAAAENESYGNNATGEFKQLYQLYLSGTEAEPSKRLRILDEGLTCSDSRVRKICVEALGQMLHTHHFSRAGGSEQIGSADRLVDWRPRTYGELQNFHREAAKRLIEITTQDHSLQTVAKELLSSHVRGLLNVLPCEEVKSMIDEVSNHHGFWPEALKDLSSWLYYDRNRAPEDIGKKIRDMFDELLPQDPIELVWLYCGSGDVELHNPDIRYTQAGGAEKNDFYYANRQAAELGEKIAENNDLVVKSINKLVCSDAKNPFPFAKSLSGSVAQPKELFRQSIELAESMTNPVNRQFFGGLIAGINSQDPEITKDCVQLALRSTKLKSEIITLLGATELKADDIKLLISLLKQRDVTPSQSAPLLYRMDHLMVQDFAPLLTELLNHGADGAWTILDIVKMYLLDGEQKLTREIAALIKRALLSRDLLASTRNNMDGYNLHSIVADLNKASKITAPFAKKLAKRLLQVCKQQSSESFYQLNDAIRKSLGVLIQNNPEGVWHEIAQKLVSSRWDVRFYSEKLLNEPDRENHLGRGISFPVQIDIFLGWVRKDAETRAALAVSWLTIADKQSNGTLIWNCEIESFVDEFAEKPHVLAELENRFTPSSWSGGLEHYLEPVVPLVKSWTDHSNSTVRNWAMTYAGNLRRQIEIERKRTEELSVRYS